MGWILVTIIVPLIAPLIVFALLRLLPLPEAALGFKVGDTSKGWPVMLGRNCFLCFCAL